MHIRVLALALTAATPIAAQRPAVVTLPPADARLETAFTAITSIRELSDGRILVTDPQDLQLVVADFRTGATKQISRRGGGPGEYGIAAPVHPIGRDSSLMSDLMQRRILLLDGDRIVETVAADNPIIRLTRGFVRFADGMGHVVFSRAPDPPDGQSVTSNKDSSSVIRIHRRTGRVDTLTKVLDRPTVRTITRNEKGDISASSARALRLRVGEQFRLYPDGWLAVVRINPFRVDWRSPEGRWSLGAPLPVPVIRMSEREKSASLARTARSMAGQPQRPLPPQLQTPDDDWPDVMPPYIYGEMATTPDGDILLRRQPSADHPGVAYYAVDRRGRLLGLIELKENERILAAGSKSIYIIETDADDLKYIRRHSWPVSRITPG